MSEGTVSYNDFNKMELVVGTVTSVEPHPNADKLVIVQVDLGSEQRQLCAGLRGHYEPAELVGKSIVVVTNLAPRKMRGEVSQGMLLAATSPDQSRIILLTPDSEIEPGSSVS